LEGSKFVVYSFFVVELGIPPWLELLDDDGRREKGVRKEGLDQFAQGVRKGAQG
jgi:hypothetical protein